MIAAMAVEKLYRPDRLQETRQVYGIISEEHPEVSHLMKA